MSARGNVLPEAESFDVATALERLNTALIRLEALSQSVVRALEYVPRVGRRARRPFGHVFELLTVLDSEIAAAMAASDESLLLLKRRQSK
jgi:ParB-like chromosome segregation protein Spo0J